MRIIAINAGEAVNTAREVTASAGTTARIDICCPRCKADVAKYKCLECGFQLRNIQGVIHALPPERIVHFGRFIEEYERLRSAEGCNSKSDEFYLGLPYSDATRRNPAQWSSVARTFDFLMDCVLKPALPNGAVVLDLGAGNCWLSYRLAQAEFRPCAVDLLTNECDGLGAAEHYRSSLPRLFPRYRAEFAHLPFRDRQFDAVVFNASFHYAEDFEAAAKEALRCCRPGGLLIICDSPWYPSRDSGKKMADEHRAGFLRKFGTACASIDREDFLTVERLKSLESHLGISWNVYSPDLSLKWTLCSLWARLRNRREPARSRIYVSQKG